MRRSIFQRLLLELQKIKWQLEDIHKELANKHYPIPAIPESKLLQLPDHLRRSYLTLVAKKIDCTAAEISGLTGRSRAIESSYLNQLTRMGWVTKHRQSKTVLFRPSQVLNEHESPPDSNI
jgi:hypothetical protein